MSGKVSQEKYTTFNLLYLCGGIALLLFLALAWQQFRSFSMVQAQGQIAEAVLSGEIEERTTRRLGPFGWTPFQFKTYRATLSFSSYKGTTVKIYRDVSKETAASLSRGTPIKVKYVLGNPGATILNDEGNPAYNTLLVGIFVSGVLFGVGALKFEGKS
jgi:hypothetical protein